MKYFLLLFISFLSGLKACSQMELLKGNWVSLSGQDQLWIVDTSTQANTIRFNTGCDEKCSVKLQHDSIQFNGDSYCTMNAIWLKILELTNRKLKLRLSTNITKHHARSGRTILFKRTEVPFKGRISFERLYYKVESCCFYSNFELEIDIARNIKYISYGDSIDASNRARMFLIPRYYTGTWDTTEYWKFIDLIDKTSLPSLHFGNLCVFDAGATTIIFNYNGQRRKIAFGEPDRDNPLVAEILDFLWSIPNASYMHSTTEKFQIDSDNGE